MNWLIGLALLGFVYVAIPPATKVNAVCSSFDTILSVAKFGVEKGTEVSVNVNRTSNVIAMPSDFNRWKSGVSISCREKVRRFVAFTDGLEVSRYRQALEAGRVHINNGSPVSHLNH